ncbi:MAG: SecY-interacting protein Syd [Pseudomonadales bacterium]|jgi:SecY interacting protein Syd
MTTAVATALDRLVARLVAAAPLSAEPFDPEWRSPCEQGAPWRDDQGVQRVNWAPCLRSSAPLDALAGLSRALELRLHPDIEAYYARWWSAGLDARASFGLVRLILLWNEDDAERLVENLLGHALSQRRRRLPFTAFVATVEPDDGTFISVDNESGSVLLERAGERPLRTLAASLADFLGELEPPSGSSPWLP